MVLSSLRGFGADQDKAETYLNVFETVWTKVNETYFDPSFGGLDWKAVRDRYRPQIAAAKTMEGFSSLVNKMLWELKVSHAAFIPPGFFASAEPLVFAVGGIGIKVRILDGQTVITSVDPGSPALKAGFRPGFVVQAIDGVPIAQVEKEVRREVPPDNERSRTAQITKGIMSRIYGTPETAVSIAYTDDKGEKREQTLTRVKRSGVPVRGIYYFAIEFEVKRLDGNIGYIRLNTLQPQLTARIPAAIKTMGDISGLILDLRGNSGGEIEGMPELFLAEKTFLYIRKARDGETNVYFDPAADVYRGPLVVLIDELSGSASELFAASLQAAKRAVVVGGRSPGSVMESDNLPFPNGAILMYPVAQLRTPDGVILEGRGVVPDIEARLQRDMLLKGVDNQLGAALDYLKNEIRKAS